MRLGRMDDGRWTLPFIITLVAHSKFMHETLTSKLTIFMKVRTSKETSVQIHLVVNVNQQQPKLFIMPTSTADFKTGHIVTDLYLQSVLATSLDTREQCMNLIDLVEANAIVASQTPSVEAQLDVSKQQRLLYSHLGHLRELNRNAILKVRNTKQTTAEARQEIDRLHLQLQNLYYEERHLRGEITACDSYE